MPSESVNPSDAFDELTSEEMELLEELVGQPLGAIFTAFENSQWGVRHIKALAFVTARREDPDLEFESFSFTAGELGSLFDPPA